MKPDSKFWRAMAAGALAALLTTTSRAQVNLAVGNVADGDSVTITFEVTINSPLPVGVTQISAQGTASGSNFSPVNTDDPETGNANDATLTVLSQNFDFGDAPDPTYPTLLANNGARHFIPGGGATLYLGAAAPDAEADGQPNSGATGDDSALDDEDGVTFPAQVVASQPYTATVFVTGSGGILNAWLDWNRDGDWNDAGEQIVTDLAISSGSTPLNLTAAAFTTSGTALARFRLSTQSGLATTGLAVDGEIEDYSVALVANASPVANADTYSVAEGGTLNQTDGRGTATPGNLSDNGVLANDTDANGDLLTASLMAPPVNASSFTLNADGSFTYTHNGGETTSDSFTYRANDGLMDSSIATVNITVSPVNDPVTATDDVLANVPEDSGLRVIPFATLLGNDSPGAGETGQTLTIVSVSTAAGGSVQINGSNVEFTPAPNIHGPASFQYTAQDNGAPSSTGTATASFNLTPVPDTPSVTGATTAEDQQSTSGLVISRNAADGAEVTHFKITGITGGTLFQNNGSTVIASGSFITFAQGNAGLKFTPALNATGNGSFTVQASLNNSDGGLGGGTATATITVTLVADTPSVTGATTLEDQQTTSGLVISRNGADGAEVTHFKITGITGGALFQNDGTTVIANGSFITFAQGNAGLKFTPVLNATVNGSFTVQASLNNSDGGLGGSTVTATITVTPVADTPSVTDASTSEDQQTASGLVISRNAADGAEVTHFKITGITGGTLFRNDGTTELVNGNFITFAQGNAGLKFTPALNAAAIGGFNVQASVNNTDGGLGGSAVTAAITVTPVADTPSVTGATTPEGQQTASGLVITRNSADGAEVTHFKITGITGGTLFQNNGATVIADGSFITFAQGNAGLRFTPTAGKFSPIAAFGFGIQAAIGPTDGGLGGSVAAASITVNPAFDFGDAPGATYPTLLANNGARHVVLSTGATLYLGSIAPDAEPDGQPHANAMGDGADEDSVVLPAFRAGLNTNITVIVTGSGGLLNAWVDWNADGDWSDANEQIATNRPVNPGGNVVNVVVPVGLPSGGSFARFRVSTQGGLSPSGQAGDGEVEDFAVMIVSNAPPIAASDTMGTRQASAAIASFTKLLANDSDPDGDALTISSVSATSTNGGSVVLGAGQITYTPLAAFVGDDRFTYTASDNRGGTSLGTVVVSVTSANAPSGNQAGVTVTTNSRQVRFYGIPGQHYVVQWAAAINGPWTTLSPTLTAAANGLIAYEDTTQPVPPTRFYRTLVVP